MVELRSSRLPLAALFVFTFLAGCGDDDTISVDTGTDTADCACENGTTETRLSEACGEESRSCVACAWSDWTETSPGMADPECRQGEAQFADREGCEDNKVRYYRCGSECTWETEPTECGGGCDGMRRTEPLDAEEICIPGGLFTRGCDDAEQDCFPRHEVYLTPFYIDRFTVTRRRYQECVDAGACTELTAWQVGSRDMMSDFDPDHFFGPNEEFDWGTLSVWGATQEQAEAFCGWDGAALASGAQWERAATGVYERVVWPWTDSREPTEDEWHPGAPSSTGGLRLLPLRRQRSFEFYVARTTSSVGIDAYFDYFEWTTDTVDSYGPATPPDRDPVIRGGAMPEMRGLTYQGRLRWFRRDIAARFNAHEWGSTDRASIRCVRSSREER